MISIQFTFQNPILQLHLGSNKRYMSKLPPTANQSHPHSSDAYISEPPQLLLQVQDSYPQKQIYGFYIHKKTFFSKNLNVNKKFTKIQKQFVLQSHVRIKVAEAQRHIV